MQNRQDSHTHIREAPISTPFTDQGKIWHARQNHGMLSHASFASIT